VFLCEEGRRFSQELVLHPQIPVFPLKLLQTSPFGQCQLRLLAGMLGSPGFHPGAEGLSYEVVLACHISDRPGLVDDFPDRRFPKFGRVFPGLAGHDFSDRFASILLEAPVRRKSGGSDLLSNFIGSRTDDLGHLPLRVAIVILAALLGIGVYREAYRDPARPRLRRR
jgi:hypothetical protein